MGLRKSEEMHSTCQCSECKEKSIRNNGTDKKSNKTEYDRPLKKVRQNIRIVLDLFFNHFKRKL